MKNKYIKINNIFKNNDKPIKFQILMNISKNISQFQIMIETKEDYSISIFIKKN